MTKRKEKILASITVRWRKNGPTVGMSGFENLSPTKIEKCFEAALKEWYHLRAVHIGERRKRELEERAGAENA